MFWNAPVGLNVFMVNLIRGTVYVFIFIIIISIIVIIDMLTYSLKNKSESEVIKLKKYIKLLLAGIFLPCIGLILFYKPHPVLPTNYIFNKITVEYVTPFERRGERITITDEKALVEFRNIFDGHQCRRTLMSKSGSTNSDIIYCDLLVYNGDKSSPIHFIFTQDELIRYTGANTDFFYIIEKNRELLSNRIFDYVNKYHKAGDES